MPGLPTFAETNLRTYVRPPSGRDGLWFFSWRSRAPSCWRRGRSARRTIPASWRSPGAGDRPLLGPETAGPRLLPACRPPR
ncbi:DUF2071 domain-containing protein [Streptomyces nogalater]